MTACTERHTAACATALAGDGLAGDGQKDMPKEDTA